jgi:hypothetical protein
MSKHELIVLDLLEEPGHVRFVKKLLHILKDTVEVTFISSDRYVREINPDKHISLPNKWFDFSGRVGFVKSQIKIIKRLKSIISNRKTPILVTGFENISFTLAWSFKNPTFAFLHNNLEKSRLSLFFLFSSTKNIVYLAFEEYIAAFCNNKNLEAYYVPHPLQLKPIDKKTEADTANFIFAPHLDVNGVHFSRLREYAKQHNLKLYGRGEPKSLLPQHVSVKTYYEDYESLLQNAGFVVLDIHYNYRISGIFYEAMMLNKKMVFINTSHRFSKEMAQLYPENVCTGAFEAVAAMMPDNSRFLSRHSDDMVLTLLLKTIYDQNSNP